jgi:hypothetical protein
MGIEEREEAFTGRDASISRAIIGWRWAAADLSRFAVASQFEEKRIAVWTGRHVSRFLYIFTFF